jgi:two-component system response regulator NreC
MAQPEPVDRTRILLADDHQMVRQALAALLNEVEDFEVVTQASDAAEATRFCLGYKPDVAVLDLNMPLATETIEAIPQILERSPATRVVVLTMDDAPGPAVSAMRAGAVGYVLKDAADEELVEAVRAASRGDSYLTPRLGASIAAAPVQDGSTGVGGLTPREREVVRMTALGHTSREIGDQLFLSLRTVETYRSRINTKLDVTNRAGLVRFALANGLVDHAAA